MRTVLDGEVHVHYGQIYVESGEEDVDLSECFAGQVNGLCGGAVPGKLFLITGLHTGNVGFTVEVHDQAPPLDDAWEEIVEVSFTPASADSMLIEWGGGDAWSLHLEQTGYRVRYSGKGMDEARELDTRLDSEPQRDRYLLQFWPAPPAADRVIKQTSRNAAYWHGVARELPPPPSPEERAEAERQARQAQEAEAERQRLEWEAAEWGGRLPCERLRQVDGNVLGMVELDRDLVDAIVAASADTQRAIAHWAARRAYTLAGLAEIDWIAPALSAAERGQPLPAPFEDFDRVWDTLWSDKRVPDTTVPSLDGTIPDMSQQAMAIPALFGAVETDPLQAALDSLYAAAVTFGPAYPALLTEVRQACPAVAEAPSH